MAAMQILVGRATVARLGKVVAWAAVTVAGLAGALAGTLVGGRAAVAMDDDWAGPGRVVAGSVSMDNWATEGSGAPASDLELDTTRSYGVPTADYGSCSG